MFNKRGLSTVVATVLVMLITVAAAAALFGQIIPFVNKSLNQGTECVEYKEYFKFDTDMGYNCYNQAGLIAFSVKAFAPNKENANISNFTVSFIGAGSSKNVIVGKGMAASGDPGNISMLNSAETIVAVPVSGEVQTYVYNPDGASYTSISIGPVLPSGRLCDFTDKINLEFCVDTTIPPRT